MFRIVFAGVVLHLLTVAALGAAVASKQPDLDEPLPVAPASADEPFPTDEAVADEPQPMEVDGSLDAADVLEADPKHLAVSEAQPSALVKPQSFYSVGDAASGSSLDEGDVLEAEAELPLDSLDAPKPLDRESAVDDEEDGSEEDEPKVDDYMKLRQRNAELAMQVEELTGEMNQLRHDKAMTRWRTKFQVSKIRRECPAPPKAMIGAAEGRPDARPHELRGSRLRSLPWSLTHTATRHRSNRNRASTDGQWPDFSSAFESVKGMVSEFREGLPSVESFYNPIADKENEEKLAAQIKHVQAHLKDTRVRLGQNKEARISLEEHIEALKKRIHEQELDAAEDEKTLAKTVEAVATADHDLSNAKAEMLRRGIQQVVSGIPDSTRAAVTQEETVKISSAKLHAEVAKRTEEAQKRLVALKAETAELQKRIDTINQRVPSELANIDDIAKQNANSTAMLSSLRSEDETLQDKEVAAEAKAQKEDVQLVASAGQQERCMDWGRKLEARLRKVRGTSSTDNKLCHNTILSLHNERMKSKQKNAKLHKELKARKKAIVELTAQADENMKTLNACLAKVS